MAAAYRFWLREHLTAAGQHRLYFDHGTQGLNGQYRPLQQQVDQFYGLRPSVPPMAR